MTIIYWQGGRRIRNYGSDGSKNKEKIIEENTMERFEEQGVKII